MQVNALHGTGNPGVMTIQLNKDELAVLIRFGTRAYFTGGFQNLVKALYSRVNKVTGEIELEPVILERLLRYSKKYGRGGFQDTFLRPVFRRSLKL